MNGEPVIITYRGKPAASITPLTENDLEDFVLEHSPRIQKMIGEGETARLKGEVIPLKDYLKSSRKRRG